MYQLTNIKAYCDDCLNLIYKFEKQDIIFFDPPWGGSDYKDKKSIRLKLSDTYIEDICRKLLDKKETACTPKIIALKLPKNYDLKYFNDIKNIETKKIEICLYSLLRMNLVIIQVAP